MTSPAGAFGSNQVDFAGNRSPSSATASNRSRLGAGSKNAAWARPSLTWLRRVRLVDSRQQMPLSGFIGNTEEALDE